MYQQQPGQYQQQPGQYQQQPGQYQQQAPPPHLQQQQYGGVRVGQPPPPPSQFYGSYGQNFQQNVFEVNAWQALSFNNPNELFMMFEGKKSQRYNAIQAQELQSMLNDAPNIRNYYRIHWSLELCKIMIAMLDRNKDGMMGWQEFDELLKCLTYWYTTFCQYDQDRSGYIEAAELGNVIATNFRYTLSAKAMSTILKRYSRALDDGRLLIAFDDFVALAVRLRAYTDAFRGRDRMTHGGQETGTTHYGYDDFLQCVMCL